VGDLDGSNRKYQLWRRMLKPFVHQYIALSKDLERYLQERIPCAACQSLPTLQWCRHLSCSIRQVVGREPLPCAGFAPADAFVIGTVGRMQAVKDQLTLARAFVLLLQMGATTRGSDYGC
jgi:hypothetical protein